MKKYSIFSLVFALWILLWVASCKPDQPVDPNEEEVITKVQLSFSDSATGAVAFVAQYSDPDGAGGAAPTRFDSIRLDSGKTYNVSIALYDESDPLNVDNITDEVQAEANQHLFCYTSSTPNVVVTRTDSDGTFPIGITTKWRAGNPANGTMVVELRHQPDGQKDGTCTPGATDVQLTFQLYVN